MSRPDELTVLRNTACVASLPPLLPPQRVRLERKPLQHGDLCYAPESDSNL
jgi:hypothetical protein